MNQSKFKQIDIPVYKDGPHAGAFAGYPHYGTEMAPNRIWKQRLRVTGYSRGRSSVKITLSDCETGQEVGEMFISSFIDAAPEAEAGSIFDGNWCVVKRGANYGLEFLGK